MSAEGFHGWVDEHLNAVPKPEQMAHDLLARCERLESEGQADDCRVRVTADGRGRVTSVELDPKVMRRGSAELAELIRTAVNAALDGVQEQQDAEIAVSMAPVIDATERLQSDFSGFLDQVRSEVAMAHLRLRR